MQRAVDTVVAAVRIGDWAMGGWSHHSMAMVKLAVFPSSFLIILFSRRSIYCKKKKKNRWRRIHPVTSISDQTSRLAASSLLLSVCLSVCLEGNRRLVARSDRGLIYRSDGQARKLSCKDWRCSVRRGRKTEQLPRGQ